MLGWLKVRDIVMCIKIRHYETERSSCIELGRVGSKFFPLVMSFLAPVIWWVGLDWVTQNRPMRNSGLTSRLWHVGYLEASLGGRSSPRRRRRRFIGRRLLTRQQNTRPSRSSKAPSSNAFRRYIAMSVYRGIGADSRKEEKKKANMVRLTHGRKSFFYIRCWRLKFFWTFLL